MSITREQLIESIQDNAVRHGYDAIPTTQVEAILHELEHTVGHGVGRERTMGTLLISLGKVVFGSSLAEVPS